MRNLDLIGFTLAGIAIAVPLVALLGRWYDRRKSNVVDLDLERAQRRHPSNVTVLHQRTAGSNVRPVLPRKWGA